MRIKKGITYPTAPVVRSDFVGQGFTLTGGATTQGNYWASPNINTTIIAQKNEKFFSELLLDATNSGITLTVLRQYLSITKLS